MLPVEDQISLLVHIARADNYVAIEENLLIHAIGRQLGLNTHQIQEIIQDPKPLGNLENLPRDEKFEHLLNVIQLMKVDHKVFQAEIEFCENLAFRLGYKPGVIAELSSYVYSDPTMASNFDKLKSIAEAHIIRR